MSVQVKLLRHDPSEQQYKFFWVKYVRAVDTRVHCQPCLLGPKSRRIRSRMFFRASQKFTLRDVALDEADCEFIYICGVTTAPYVWGRNFHLAMRRSESGVIKTRWFGLTVEITGAERLQISPDFIPQHCELASDRGYATCRNVQFAWAYRRGLYLPPHEVSRCEREARGVWTRKSEIELSS